MSAGGINHVAPVFARSPLLRVISGRFYCTPRACRRDAGSSQDNRIDNERQHYGTRALFAKRRNANNSNPSSPPVLRFIIEATVFLPGTGHRLSPSRGYTYRGVPFPPHPLPRKAARALAMAICTVAQTARRRINGLLVVVLSHKATKPPPR